MGSVGLSYMLHSIVGATVLIFNVVQPYSLVCDLGAWANFIYSVLSENRGRISSWLHQQMFFASPKHLMCAPKCLLVVDFQGIFITSKNSKRSIQPSYGLILKQAISMLHIY